MKPVFLSAMILAVCVPGIFAQAPVAAEPYDVAEAYRVYSVLIPEEQSYRFAKGTLIFQQETVSDQKASTACLSKEAADEFKEAIADFDQVNSKQWLLQRELEIDKPYELVSSGMIKALIQTEQGPNWNDFYNRYPDSGGYFIFSAVGFNKEKTLAIVYSGSGCGGLCGMGAFHLLEKQKGEWKVVPGVSCITVS